MLLLFVQSPKLVYLHIEVWGQHPITLTPLITLKRLWGEYISKITYCIVCVSTVCIQDTLLDIFIQDRSVQIQV